MESEFRSFPQDVVALILEKLPPIDLLSGSCVCSSWRAVACDVSQLRSWTYDDDISDVMGTKASVTPMKPKTPLPKHWVNPTAFSPLASFKTPKSLNSLQAPNALTPLLHRTSGILDSADAGCSSPRTPSPIQHIETRSSFSEIVRCNMKAGRFLGDVDVSSSRLSDSTVELILRSCPNLHTLRLQHICGGRQYFRDRSNFQGPDLEGQRTSPVAACGCGHFTERAFKGVAQLCPNLSSVTLVLQHVAYRKVLRLTLAELGALPKLHTLSVELRMPSFGLSVKSEFLWLDHARCCDAEVYALLKAGPPPLQALALNRCDLSESCVAALAEYCPRLEAVDLHSPNLQNLGWQGLCPEVGERLKSLRNLTAAAFGIFTKLGECHFDNWLLPALKRLRLETKEPLSADHLHCLVTACPKLESLHLLWTTYRGSREAHICPVTDENILEFVRLI